MVPSVILDDLIIVQILNKKNSNNSLYFCNVFVLRCFDQGRFVKCYPWIRGTGTDKVFCHHHPPPSEVAWETEKDPVGFCLKIVPVFK